MRVFTRARIKSRRAGEKIRKHLPPSWANAFRWTLHGDFITYHWAYFLLTPLIASVIIWTSSSPKGDVLYTDALFLSVSAMTLAGLNTVNLSLLTPFQQAVLYVLTLLGSAIFVSIFVVHLRRAAFKRRLWQLGPGTGVEGGQRAAPVEQPVASDHARPEQRDEIRVLGDFHPVPRPAVAASAVAIPNESAIVDDEDDGKHHHHPDATATTTGSSSEPAQGTDIHVAFPPSMRGHRSGTLRLGQTNQATSTLRKRRASSTNHPPTLYLSFTPTVTRNSQFSNLTPEQRLELGGVEFRALTLLSYLVPAYFIILQTGGSVLLWAYTSVRRPEVGDGLEGGQGSPDSHVGSFWLSTFNAVSAFNNNGMSLLDQNMTVFSGDWYVLLIMSFLILAGNTCYPIFLRLILWIMKKILAKLVYRARSADEPLDHSSKKVRLLETVTFLLDHPRRCYTNLFKRRQTLWLAASVLMLNGTDWIMFKILNIGNKKLGYLTTSEIIIDGLFQAIAVRCGGFYVVPIPYIRISLQLLYVIMMYISVYPVAVAIRNTNMYEERSLGIYADLDNTDDYEDDPEDTDTFYASSTASSTVKGGGGEATGTQARRPRKRTPAAYFLRHQIRAQLAHDLWWLALAVFGILIVETGRFESDPVNFSVFNVIFEAVSAYGCVGISMGYPGVDYSFCGEWHKLSKLILMAVMLRGRHRGLPVAIDAAIELPGERRILGNEEEQDVHMRRRASGTFSRSNI